MVKIDPEELKIKEYTFWILYLNEYQCYLGRTYLVAKRFDAIDLFETTEEERFELFSIGQEIHSALKKLFQPDYMNYASLGKLIILNQ